MAVALSVIIPAYNEAWRLPSYLGSVRKHLDLKYPGSYEVIVVDDGSRDGLPEVLAPLIARWPQLVLLQHGANRGKGAAVRTGMLAARGRLLLFADADGAAPIDQEAKLAEAIRAGADLAVGSRLVAGRQLTRRRSWRRALVGRLFAALASWWLPVRVRDPQCGFKMFRREAARQLFSQGRETGYLFDLELLLLADRLGWHVAEVPISWSDVPGGHLSLVREFWPVLAGLGRLRRRLG